MRRILALALVSFIACVAVASPTLAAPSHGDFPVRATDLWSSLEEWVEGLVTVFAEKTESPQEPATDEPSDPLATPDADTPESSNEGDGETLGGWDPWG